MAGVYVTPCHSGWTTGAEMEYNIPQALGLEPREDACLDVLIP